MEAVMTRWLGTWLCSRIEPISALLLMVMMHRVIGVEATATVRDLATAPLLAVAHGGAGGN